MALRSVTGFRTDITYFSGGLIEKGDFVYRTKDRQHQIVKKVKKPKHIPKAIGLSLHNVVDIDLSRHHLSPYDGEAMLGSKIEILTSGIIEIQVRCEGLQKKQNMYLQKDGTLNWMYSPLLVGIVTRDQDVEGFVQIEMSL